MKNTLWIMIACFMAVGCATQSQLPPGEDLIGRKDVDSLLEWSKSEERTLNESGLIYENQEVENYLDKVAKRLQPPEIPGYVSFRIKLMENPGLNAFALPDGALYIDTGLLARIDNEAQLATLLAHEMAHCLRGHALKALREIKKKAAFDGVVGEDLTGFEEMHDFPPNPNGLMTAISGYSQDLETEADMVGLRLMVRAGYDPGEAPRLLDLLKKEVDEEGLKEPLFFRTHPRIRVRMEKFRDFLRNLHQAKGEGIKNRGVFLASVRRVILDNAQLDLKAGRFHSAERGVKKFLTIEPNDAKAYYLLGEIYRQRGSGEDTQKAKTYYRKAITIDPVYPDPHKSIGLIYYKEGEKTLARAFLRSFLSLSPPTPENEFIRGYLEKCNE